MFFRGVNSLQKYCFLYNVKILILHQYLKRLKQEDRYVRIYLAKALVERGIETVVITTHNGSEIKKEIVEGIEVHYLPIPYDNRFGFFKRVSSFLKFVWSIVKEAGQFKDAECVMQSQLHLPLDLLLSGLKIDTRFRTILKWAICGRMLQSKLELLKTLSSNQFYTNWRDQPIKELV